MQRLLDGGAVQVRGQVASAASQAWQEISKQGGEHGRMESGKEQRMAKGREQYETARALGTAQEAAVKLRVHMLQG